jgi:hypothetical protein
MNNTIINRRLTDCQLESLVKYYGWVTAKYNTDGQLFFCRYKNFGDKEEQWPLVTEKHLEEWWLALTKPW